MSDLRGLWRDNFCAFLLGCSFSFEQSLEAAGEGYLVITPSARRVLQP